MCLARLLLFTCGCITPAEKADWIRRCRHGKIFDYSECTARKTRTYVLSFPCWACRQASKLGDAGVDGGEGMVVDVVEGDAIEELGEKMEKMLVEEGRREGGR